MSRLSRKSGSSPPARASRVHSRVDSRCSISVAALSGLRTTKASAVRIRRVPWQRRGRRRIQPARLMVGGIPWRLWGWLIVRQGSPPLSQLDRPEDDLSTNADSSYLEQGEHVVDALLVCMPISFDLSGNEREHRRHVSAAWFLRPVLQQHLRAESETPAFSRPKDGDARSKCHNESDQRQAGEDAEARSPQRLSPQEGSNDRSCAEQHPGSTSDLIQASSLQLDRANGLSVGQLLGGQHNETNSCALGGRTSGRFGCSPERDF